MAKKQEITVPTLAITSGASEFQIYQQDRTGRADIHLAGTWEAPKGCRNIRVLVQMQSEEDGAAVPGAEKWAAAGKVGRGTWSHVLRGIPAGGLYQLQTRIAWTAPDGRAQEAGGPVVHHLGVGDIWLIGGQSNAAGCGRGFVEDGPQLGVHLLKGGRKWDLAVHPFNDGAGSSPYLKFAKVLQQKLGYPIGLIQAASDGSALERWHPEESAQADLWHNMVRCVKLAGGRIRGLQWYQGCHDATVPAKPHWAERYGERFARFIELARREFGDFPVIVAQINRWTDVLLVEECHRGWSKVREHQRHVERIGRACCVPTLDLAVSDGIHNSSASNVVLGERLARAALGMVYKQPVAWRAPDVERAAAADRGRAVVLEFKHVASRLILIGLGLQDFRIEDADGAVEVTKTICTGATVRLELARPIRGKAQVHGAYGASPEVGIRDSNTNLPMLGFYGLPVKATR
jgi:hypothetical protein